MKIGLTFDLKATAIKAEHDPADFDAEFDSLETIAGLEATLQNLGHVVVRIGNIFDLLSFLAHERVDLVFNIAEGRTARSREAQIPAVLDAYNIPYTFSDPLTMALCLHKGFTKQIWQNVGLATPKFSVIASMTDFEQKKLSLPAFPLFVKPVHEGTSKGIAAHSIIKDMAGLETRVEWLLQEYQQPVIVEEYLSGREFTVGIVGNGRDAKIIGIIEILLKFNKLTYGFDEKKNCEVYQVGYQTVETEPLKSDLANLALAAYHAVECKDVGRVDLKLDSNERPQLLEINPLPGLNPIHSDLAILGRHVGWDYSWIIQQILLATQARWHLK